MLTRLTRAALVATSRRPIVLAARAASSGTALRSSSPAVSLRATAPPPSSVLFRSGAGRAAPALPQLMAHARLFSKKKKQKKQKGAAADGGADSANEEDGGDGGGAAGVFDWDPDEVRLEMHDAVERLQSRLASIRSGRNHVDSFNSVSVEAYGEHVPLSQVGQVVSKNPRLVTVNVFDKENVAAVDEAIRLFDSDLNPTVADNIVTIQLVKVTKEARAKNAKTAKHEAEGIKTQLRNIRHTHLNAIKKSKALTEDERYQLQDELQEITDAATKEVDAVVAKKTEEIMTM